VEESGGEGERGPASGQSWLGVGEVKGGSRSRHGCWRDIGEGTEGGWGHSRSSCPLTDELGNGPSLKGLGGQAHTHTHTHTHTHRHTHMHIHTHTHTSSPVPLTVDGMPPRLFFVRRRESTHLWFTYVRTSSDRLASQATARQTDRPCSPALLSLSLSCWPPLILLLRFSKL